MMWEVAFGIVIAVLILLLWPLLIVIAVYLIMIATAIVTLVIVGIMYAVGFILHLTGMFDERKDK